MNDSNSSLVDSMGSNVTNSSSQTSSVTPAATESYNIDDVYSTLTEVKQYHEAEYARLGNIETLSLSLLLGVGVVIGVILCCIFSSWLKR